MDVGGVGRHDWKKKVRKQQKIYLTSLITLLVIFFKLIGLDQQQKNIHCLYALKKVRVEKSSQNGCINQGSRMRFLWASYANARNS